MKRNVECYTSFLYPVFKACTVYSVRQKLLIFVPWTYSALNDIKKRKHKFRDSCFSISQRSCWPIVLAQMRFVVDIHDESFALENRPKQRSTRSPLDRPPPLQLLEPCNWNYKPKPGPKFAMRATVPSTYESWSSFVKRLDFAKLHLASTLGLSLYR